VRLQPRHASLNPRRLAQQLRQLGDIGGDAPSLVAGQTDSSSQAVRRSDMSGIGGKAEVQGLRLKRR